MRDGDRAAADCVAVEREVAEVPLLLSQWELLALEQAARRFELTTAQLLRHLVHEFLAERQAGHS